MLEEIKSIYILKMIFEYVPKGVYLRLSNHNKTLQKNLDIHIDEFKIYSNQIIIELIPVIKKFPYKSTFINTCGKESSYHIYFNDSFEEIGRNYLLENEQVSKIKVVIDGDEEIESFNGLFKCVIHIKEIRFINSRK